ncbi:dienelactone hydrolase family protein [Amycolatopsis sp. NPDC051061]|uniref:dienelactone hydrolase family protein n=1 Tax=Amycolatopsis sp. NPDC051061 TaxID=3155042 RepID=UPI00343D570B
MTRVKPLERYPRPVSATAAKTVIHTSPAGLATARVAIPGRGHDVPAYVARPEGAGPLPVVLVLSEVFGLHPYVEDVARRFAHAGYLAVVADLMAPQGDPDDFADVDRLVTDLLQHIPDEQVMADLDAVLDWATANGGDAGRVAVNGFSWGGRWTWLFAAHRQVAAAVSWYGVLDDSVSNLQPDRALFPHHPIDLAGALRTPVLGLYAGKDEVVPVATVDAMRSALAARAVPGPEVEFAVFPDAVHGFFADYRDEFSPADAPVAWARALRWLREHGV